MARPHIKSCVLIESSPSESDEQFRAYVTELLASIFRHTDSLEFTVGRRIWWRDTQFREFICIAGSVSCQLIVHAMRPPGFSRAIITYGSSRDGRPVSQEIREGEEKSFDPEELQMA